MARVYRTGPILPKSGKPTPEFVSRLLEPADFDTDWDEGYVQTTQEDVAQYVRFHR